MTGEFGNDSRDRIVEFTSTVEAVPEVVTEVEEEVDIEGIDNESEQEIGESDDEDFLISLEGLDGDDEFVDVEFRE